MQVSFSNFFLNFNNYNSQQKRSGPEGIHSVII